MRRETGPGNQGAPPDLGHATLTRRPAAAGLRDPEVPERAGGGDLTVGGRAVDQRRGVADAGLGERTSEFARVLRADARAAECGRERGEVGRGREPVADARVAGEGVDASVAAVVE